MNSTEIKKHQLGSIRIRTYADYDNSDSLAIMRHQLNRLHHYAAPKKEYQMGLVRIY